jgi:hypothetical protein
MTATSLNYTTKQRADQVRTWVSKLVPVRRAAEAHAIRLGAGPGDIELQWENDSTAQHGGGGCQGFEV